MASVSSLDRDMKKLRLSKYTPQAANEIRAWVESALGEQLQQGDLLEALKDGTALCKLVNLVAPGSVRFKASSMPFVQMENISHFLRASQQPPLNLQSHDIFQTVDLYEAKDPAQVLQCISAFSRKAHAAQPGIFKDFIGEKSKAGYVSPQTTGSYTATSPQYGRPRKNSNLSETNSTVSSNPSRGIGGRGSPFRPAASTSSLSGSSPPSTSTMSSWSKKADEGSTIPAWNIHQYGYMGGASQGNQGIAFGARRQITSAAPHVPSLAEKERVRREKVAEEERRRVQAEQADAQCREVKAAEEEKERIAEEERWAAETRRQREIEKQRIEEEKKRWEAEERRWKEEDELRAKEEQEAESRLATEREQKQAASDVRLTGQFLSQYQADQKRNIGAGEVVKPAESDRIKELERQLEEAKAREAEYERERQERLHDQNRERSRSRRPDAEAKRDKSRSKSRTRSVPSIPITTKGDDVWEEDERDYLRKQWAQNQAAVPAKTSPRPLPSPQLAKSPQQQEVPPLQSTRPLPVPVDTKPTVSTPVSLPQSTRPLPDPSNYQTPNGSPPKSPRKSPFTRPTATPSPPPSTSSFNTTSSSKPSASSYATAPSSTRKAPSSLLSREMELDRQRQQEWEEDQKATQSRAGRIGGVGLDGESSTPGGGAWDTSQYGFLGGDSQNKGATGIGFGMGRRQLVGPREMGKKD